MYNCVNVSCYLYVKVKAAFLPKYYSDFFALLIKNFLTLKVIPSNYFLKKILL